MFAASLRPIGLALLIVLLFAVARPAWSNEVSTTVDLGKSGASGDWDFLQEEASIADGELVLDSCKRPGLVVAFLKEPVLSDLTLRCKVYVEPEGPGGRAFAVIFHSPGSLCYQCVHVDRREARLLYWTDRRPSGETCGEPAAVDRREGTWLDAKLECVGAAVRFYLDGKLILSRQHAGWKAGRVGFGSRQALVRVKDIKVEGTPVALEKPWRLDRLSPCGTFHELAPDYRHTDVSGKIEITVSKPFIISSHLARPEMGTHEQPHLFKLHSGDILLVFHKDTDIHGAQRVSLRSRDDGRTWTPEPQRVNREEAIGALGDGKTVLAYDCYSFMKGDDVYAKEMFVSRDGGETFDGPLLAMTRAPQLGKTLSTPVSPRGKNVAARYEKTSAQWSSVGGPNFWRTVLELDDGTLLACGHTKFKGDKKLRCVCYRSTDKGKTWTAASTIAHDPSVGGEGFCEPVMSLCSNGDVVCLMREYLWQARSTDGGKTWQKVRKITDSFTVDPDLCLMTGGVLACSYGMKSYNRIMFSADGTARQWTDRLKIYEGRHVNGRYITRVSSFGGSFGYTGIVEVEPGKLLYVYDRHDMYPEYDGRRTTAIQGVYITVRKKN